jgi:hypothetical protein
MQPGVAWGDWTHLFVYIAKLNWFLPVVFMPAVGAIATFAEVSLALLLLIDAWPRYTALSHDLRLGNQSPSG